MVEVKIDYDTQEGKLHMGDLILVPKVSGDMILMLCNFPCGQGILINMVSGNRYSDTILDMNIRGEVSMEKVRSIIGTFQVVKSASLKVLM